MTKKYKTYIEYLDSVCSKDNFFFIQIGAHEGGTINREKREWSPHLIDRLHLYIEKFKWKGILVEPHEGSFKKLIKFYDKQKDDLIFENIAISEKNGEATLYISSSTELSSLVDVNPILKKTLVATKTVKTLTINELCKKHNVKNYNLLQIDTEGYDTKIIKDIDFSVARPEAICFEYIHSGNKELDETYSFLKQNNYNLVFKDNFDCLFTL